ncbi:serine-rich adhesin for platelets [Anopheles aquasalis]|uniref:serine-rich adhesin for platelets n=1 Tax=Anopheles aquasalis TaxID=42839 RepID=UPI00215B61B1|nr:serine-rich adhesin for platelets [Anopheles aquasalis]XP_050095715.1 serine-rich adhesin for platelets [Anopheles aquasalis]
MSTEVDPLAVTTVTPAGPRVSFNRDVHVKRIGSRSDPSRSQPANGAVRKELPEHLSQEALRKEAEFVLAQADKIDRRTRSNSIGSATPNARNGPELTDSRFNSLPSRKSRTKRAITRSSSDAASKKPSKGLLNLFGRKQPQEAGTGEQQTGTKGAQLGRSKSDVGSRTSGVNQQNRRPGTSQRHSKVTPRRATQELGELRSTLQTSKKHDPLTPIIEASPLEYSAQDDPLTAFVRHRRERAVSEEPPSSQPLSQRTVATRSTAFVRPVMETVGHELRSTSSSRSVAGNLHSSQLPPEKPHLTKGVTVEGIVKRLSTARHTSPPPPQIVNGGFSYTHQPVPLASPDTANGGTSTPVTFGNRQYTTSTTTTTEEEETMERSGVGKIRQPSTGFLDATQRPSPPLPKYRLDEADHSPRSMFRTVRHTNANSDEDEGLGIDYGRQQRFKSSAYLSSTDGHKTSSKMTSTTTGITIPVVERTSPKSFFTTSDEDHLITPVVRSTPVHGGGGGGGGEKSYQTNERYSVHYRGQADGKEHFPEFHELSQRREILESRIRSRIGSRDLLDRLSPERTVPVPIQLHGSAGSRYRSTTERRSVDRVLESSQPRHSPVLVRGGTLSPTPTFREQQQQQHHHRVEEQHRRVGRSSSAKGSGQGYLETHVTKTVIHRDGKPVSEEYVERRKYPGDTVEAVSTSRTIYDREGSAGRTETVKRYSGRYGAPEQTLVTRHTTDKGDSGIENDFRKDSFNHEYNLGNKFTLTENVRACEDFLRMERTHTNSCMRKPRRTYAYRERSIDDGSRYDPRLDEISASRSYTRDHPAASLKSSLKAEKKTGSLAKMKQFVSSTRKKFSRQQGTDTLDSKRDGQSSSRAGSVRSDSDPASRIGAPDIASRRRLSTPKSSPSSAKRSLSFKSSKVSGDGTKPVAAGSSKPEWFKSFDRLTSRKKLLHSGGSKTNVSGENTKTLPPPAKQTKSLRFFGDTDTEYGTEQQAVSRSARSNLSKSDKKYRSAYDLDTTPKLREAARNRSSSLHNLDEEEDELSLRGKDYRTLEQRSSTLIRTRSPSPPPPLGTVYHRQERTVTAHRDYTPERVSRKSHHRSREASMDMVDSERRSATPSRLGGSRSRSEQHKKPPVGPPKPARAFERRDSLNRDIDRILDSSGTEGESSQQSQRSVVFLHATTVGDIPHPQIAKARRRAYSRESLNNSVTSSKPKVQPMTRTVSRSISVLAPWKPKNIREGYEIDYHKEQHQTKPISTLPRPGTASRQSTAGSQSTLSRSKHRSVAASQPSIARDDQDSDKSSSFVEHSRRSSIATEQQPRRTGGSATPYASTTLPSSRRMKDSIAQYPSRTGGSGSTLKYRR